MKQKLLKLLSQPSTWRGLIMSLGGVITLIGDHINPHFLTISIPVVMYLVGMIGVLTDDSKDTDSKVDDIVHAAVEGIIGKSK